MTDNRQRMCVRARVWMYLFGVQLLVLLFKKRARSRRGHAPRVYS